MAKRDRKSTDLERVGNLWNALIALRCPPEVAPGTWASVMWVLHRLTRYAKYEVIRPTQDQLAKDLGLSRTFVRKRLDLAEQWGLIKRTATLEGGRWQFTVYELLFHHGQPLAMDPGQPPATDRGQPLATNTLPLTEEVLKTGDYVSRDRRDSTCGRIDIREVTTAMEPGEEEEPSPGSSPQRRSVNDIALAYGERASKRISPRPKKAPTDISRRTADYFAAQWEAVVYERPEFHDFRCLDGIEQATGYFRATFFQPQAGRRYTEESVRAMIDDFMASVQTSRLLVKPKQSVFLRFTGAWGRGRKAVAPPATNTDYGFS